MLISVDVEANGPCPGLYSMFWIGAVVIKPGLNLTFEGRLRPMAFTMVEDGDANIGYKLAGVTHSEVMSWGDPGIVMSKFEAWLGSLGGQLRFISDNNGYDWQFVNYYFHKFCGRNPFGFSSINLGSLYKGLVQDTRKNFKHLRQTAHTHNPVDDARGNAEAILTLHQMFPGAKLL